MEAHLFNPDGGLVAVLPHPASHEAILRAAYGLGQKDVIAAVANEDLGWQLTIIALEEKPAGDMLRSLPFHLNDRRSEGTEARLMEFAVLDLWDRGWSVKAAD